MARLSSANFHEVLVNSEDYNPDKHPADDVNDIAIRLIWFTEPKS